MSLTSIVAFQFTPPGHTKPNLKNCKEIGIEAFLEQIKNDDRPYAEVPTDLFAEAKYVLKKQFSNPTNDQIAALLLKAPGVKHRIERPVNVDFYIFSRA